MACAKVLGSPGLDFDVTVLGGKHTQTLMSEYFPSPARWFLGLLDGEIRLGR
jgi:hypothetical protein